MGVTVGVVMVVEAMAGATVAGETVEVAMVVEAMVVVGWAVVGMGAEERVVVVMGAVVTVVVVKANGGEKMRISAMCNFRFAPGSTSVTHSPLAPWQRKEKGPPSV